MSSKSTFAFVFQRGSRWLCVVLAFALLLGTTACKSARTNITPLLPKVRMDPPARGMNKVWVEFLDESGQAPGFEDTVYESTEDALASKGYEIVDRPREANYVLWGTLHCIEQVDDSEQVDKLLADLGPIAGANRGQQAGEGSDDGWGSTVVSDTLGGGMTGFFSTLFTRNRAFLLVCDAQLSQRREGTSEGDMGLDDSISTAEEVRALFEIAKEQRYVISASGSNMSLPKAVKLLTPEMEAALAGQLQRYRE